jgi:hypothetical protein
MCEANWEVIVNLLGILINGFLAWWIVSNIQKKQNNDRIIKDHFINEVKELRIDCKKFLQKAYNGDCTQNEIITSTRLIGIKSSDILNLLERRLLINHAYLNSYHIELNRILTDDKGFIIANDEKIKVKLSKQGELLLLQFQAQHNSRFNDLILEINDCKQ